VFSRFFLRAGTVFRFTAAALIKSDGTVVENVDTGAKLALPWSG